MNTPTLLNALLLLVNTFALVFALGLQSQLVNNGHHLGAFVNSLAIGTANLVLFKLAPNASSIEVAGYLLGGPFGIVASMHAYRWMRGQVTTAQATSRKPEHQGPCTHTCHDHLEPKNHA